MIHYFASTEGYWARNRLTENKLTWNQNVILYLERGAAAVMNIKFWKRCIEERDELMKMAESVIKEQLKIFRKIL